VTNKTFMLLLTVSMLSSCATQAGYKKVLDSWVGHTELELVRAWGPPVRAHDISDSRFLEFHRSGNLVLPGSDPTYTTTVIGNTAYTTSSGGSSPTNIALSCATTFEVRNGVIISWRYQGNNCGA
jgi:hypothetical protein